MAATLDLYNDTVNGTLVLGLSDRAPLQLSEFYQGSKIQVRYYPIKPIEARVIAPFYTNLDLDQLTLEIAIGARAGAEDLLAYQGTWSKQYNSGSSGAGYMHATLDLNTSEMNTEIGSSDAITSHLEIKLSESGVARVVYQRPIRINSVVLGPSGAASLPTPTAEYFTKAEIMELMARLGVNPAGRTITLSSPDNSKFRIIGVRNDGSAQDDLIG